MRHVFDSIMTIIGFVFALGIVFFIMSDRLTLASTLISGSFIFVLLSFCLMILHRRISHRYLQLFFLCSLLVFFNVTLSGTGGFDYYKKSIMFLAFLIWMICASSIIPSRGTVIVSICLCILINLLYYYFYDRGFSVYDGQVLLTLNFPNPNQTGLFILNSMMYLALPFLAGKDLGYNRKQIFVPALALVFLIIGTYELLFKTGCRSALIALLVFAILLFLDLILNKRMMKIPKWVILLIVLAPFIFVFVYLAYAPQLAIDSSFGVEEAGKTNVSRIHIWMPIVNNIAHYFLFGDYYGISNGTGVSQLHNTHLDVFASYGIIPFLLFIVLLYRVLSSSVQRAETRFQRISIYAFICCLVSGSFEASLVSGSAGLYLLSAGFLVLSNYNQKSASTTL